MFLLKDRRLGMDHFVFISTDPRPEGCRGEVTEGVELNYNMNAIHEWPYGEPSPRPQLGRDPNNRLHYKVFRSPEELNGSGYEFVNSNSPFVVTSWTAYRRQYYPVPEEFAKSMSQEEWYEYLEDADTAAKVRSGLNGVPEPKAGSHRDEIAEWVAKRHMSADGGIQRIWYLHSGSPADEIRLLDVSERAAEFSEVEPVDFGLDVGGVKFKLLVADITPSMFGKLKADPSKLPKSWKLDSAISWGRRI